MSSIDTASQVAPDDTVDRVYATFTKSMPMSLYRSSMQTLVLIILVLATGANLQAQLRDRGAAERDPGRLGIFGARREARDERLGRLDAAAANAYGRNAPGLAGRPLQPLPVPPPVDRRTANSNQIPPANRQSAVSNSRAPGPNTPPVPPANSQRGVVPASNVAVRNPVPSGNNPAAMLGQPSSPLPQNRITYRGPGVLIQLPNNYDSEIHFLVDEVEPLTLRPGEQYRLTTKSSFVVRFSRGAVAERSLGEAYYSISEGVYRFTMTSRGWELYRQVEGQLPSAAEKSLALPEQRSQQTDAFAKEATDRKLSLDLGAFSDPSDSTPPLTEQDTESDRRTTNEFPEATEELPRPIPKPEPKSIIE